MPYSLAGFKRQQFRWAKGSVQCLRKHWRTVAADSGSLWRKLQAALHLAGYLAHPLMLVLLASLPLALAGGYSGVALGVLGVAGFGPPVMCAVAQRALYPDPLRRFAIFPALLLLQVGMQASNARGVLEGLLGRNPRMFCARPSQARLAASFPAVRTTRCPWIGQPGLNLCWVHMHCLLRRWLRARLACCRFCCCWPRATCTRLRLGWLKHGASIGQQARHAVPAGRA